MYDAYYDEYMRNVLGYGDTPDYRRLYSMMPQDLYNMNTYMTGDIQEQQMMDEDLDDCYPEIYKIVYPMVQKACKKNNKPITKKLIDDMVNEIYVNIEPNDSININVNVGNTSKVNSYSSDREVKGVTATRSPEVKTEVREARGDTRQKETRQKNYILNDLIRILVLRELIGKSTRPGNNRPPQRPPIRPPYPGPGMRPPIRPRGDYDYDYNYGLYEY